MWGLERSWGWGSLLELPPKAKDSHMGSWVANTTPITAEFPGVRLSERAAVGPRFFNTDSYCILLSDILL